MWNIWSPSGRQADLGDEDLDLHRLHLVGEDLAEDLGVLVGQAAGVDVVAAVLEALEVGGPHAGHAQLVELVVLADAGEGDAVVDLADLAQRLGAVLGDDGDAVGVAQGDEGPAAGDALAGVVRPVLHHLLGRDVERHAHEPRPPMRASERQRAERRAPACVAGERNERHAHEPRPPMRASERRASEERQRRAVSAACVAGSE